MKTPNPSKEASPDKEGNGETLDRDNPVPSLDGIDKALIIESLHLSIKNEIFYTKKRQLMKLLAKLQHGVETNKVQPNCKYIRKEGSSCSLNNNCKYPNCNTSRSERKSGLYVGRIDVH